MNVLTSASLHFAILVCLSFFSVWAVYDDLNALVLVASTVAMVQLVHLVFVLEQDAPFIRDIAARVFNYRAKELFDVTSAKHIVISAVVCAGIEFLIITGFHVLGVF